MIEVEVIVNGHGNDGVGYTRVNRRGEDPARLIAEALGQIAENVDSPKLEAIAEAAYRITREDQQTHDH